MKALRYLVGSLFVYAGTLHFTRPRFYLAMMPPWIPMHKEAVAVSGAAEIAGGVALLSARTARFGGWWLIALLVTVFPANLHMAMNPDQVKGWDKSGIPNWMLWARLPLQPLAIWLVWLATKPDRPTD